MNFRLAAMIMAAGESRRFGGCKHLANIGSTTVLQHVVDVANSRLPDQVHVVTGRYHDAIQQQIQHAEFIYNPDWEAGLGSSIATGVTHLASLYDGLLILLGDQVALESQHLEQLIDAFDDKHISCARYAATNGVPALFPRACYHSLQQLNGKQGAKRLLNHTQTALRSIDMPAAAVDVDTCDDLASLALQAKYQSAISG